MKNHGIIAHRGASFDAPENTLSAIRLAWEQGADAVEIDVRLSQDQRIILMHDESALRTTGQDSLVALQTVEQLKSLDAGSWKDARFAGEPVPTLAEVLSELPEGKELVIEIKDKQPEIVPILKKDLEQAKVLSAQITIISFDLTIAKLSKAQLPAVKVLPLHGKSDSAQIEEQLCFCQENSLDGLDLHHASAIDRALADRFHSQKLLLYVWTVNDIEAARHLFAVGVGGITTDRPKLLREEAIPQ